MSASIDNCFARIRNESSDIAVIAAVQMRSTDNKAKNIAVCEKMIIKASQDGAKLVCLPECCWFIGKSREDTLAAAEVLSGPDTPMNTPLSPAEIQCATSSSHSIQYFRKLAVLNNVWLSLGGIQELRSDLEPNKISNSHVIISPDGSIKAVYRKVIALLYLQK